MLADRGGHGSASVPRAEHAHRRPGGPRGEWQRYAGVLDGGVDAARRPATSRTSPASKLASGNVVAGWGMAIGTHNDSYAGDRRPRRGQQEDRQGHASSTSTRRRTPGFIDQPGPDHEPDVRQPHPVGTSRVLHEELQFDKKRVTSRDWVSYPILRFKDTPKVTTVDRPPRRSRRVRLGRAAAAVGERRDRERDLRRNGRAHDAGSVDAVPRPRLPERQVGSGSIRRSKRPGSARGPAFSRCSGPLVTIASSERRA